MIRRVLVDLLLEAYPDAALGYDQGDSTMIYRGMERWVMLKDRPYGIKVLFRPGDIASWVRKYDYTDPLFPGNLMADVARLFCR